MATPFVIHAAPAADQGDNTTSALRIMTAHVIRFGVTVKDRMSHDNKPQIEASVVATFAVDGRTSTTAIYTVLLPVAETDKAAIQAQKDVMRDDCARFLAAMFNYFHYDDAPEGHEWTFECAAFLEMGMVDKFADLRTMTPPAKESV